MKSKRKLWIPIAAAVLAVAVGAGALLAPRFLQPEPVPVYAVNMIGYTDFYSGNSESYGMVTTDKVQTAWVSDTQTITEILVYEGQSVKKGDVLYTYDTTLSDLSLERKDLAIQQLEVTLKTAQAELKALKAMKPISYKEDTSTNRSKYTKSPSDKKLLGTVYSSTTGRSRLSPLYYWMEDGSGAMSSVISTSLIEYLFDQAVGKNADSIYVVFQSTSGNKTNTEYEYQYGVCFTKSWKAPDPVTSPEPDAAAQVHGMQSVDAPANAQALMTDTAEETDTADPTGPESTETEPTVPESSETEPTVPEPSETEPTEPEPTETEPTVPEPSDPEPTETEPTVPDPSDPEPTDPEPTDPEPSDPEPTDPEPTDPEPEKVFAGYSISFFEPSSIDEDNSSVDWNSGYTSGELSALKSEKQAEITQLQFDIKMGKAELKIMQKEADSGQVLAQFDGVVTGVTEPLAASSQNVPLMKVIGGGGYYVEGTVSELELDTVQLGQSITVTSWDTGETLQGTVVEVGSYPAEDQGYGSTGVSYYPYRVFIDQTANLAEGYYVSLIIQSETASEGTLYLQNAFLRTDGSRTYVYVRDAEGLLEKRYVEAGISQDGYMTPIYSGLSDLDFIAFPYGNDVSEDAPTYEGTMDELYGY